MAGRQRKECVSCGWEQTGHAGAFVLVCPECHATEWRRPEGAESHV